MTIECYGEFIVKQFILLTELQYNYCITTTVEFKSMLSTMVIDTCVSPVPPVLNVFFRAHNGLLSRKHIHDNIHDYKSDSIQYLITIFMYHI